MERIWNYPGFLKMEKRRRMYIERERKKVRVGTENR